MTKTEFIELLQELNIPINEGESSVTNSTKYPRIVFWDYLWEDKMASDDNYVSVETYQVSFFSKTPTGPFQITVLAFLIAFENSLIVFLQIS